MSEGSRSRDFDYFDESTIFLLSYFSTLQCSQIVPNLGRLQCVLDRSASREVSLYRSYRHICWAWFKSSKEQDLRWKRNRSFNPGSIATIGATGMIRHGVSSRCNGLCTSLAHSMWSCLKCFARPIYKTCLKISASHNCISTCHITSWMLLVSGLRCTIRTRPLQAL